MLNKQPLTRFSVWDESGMRLPVLTTSQNGALAGALLAGVAATVARSDSVGVFLPDEVAAALRQVATLPSKKAQLLLRCLQLDPWDQAELLGPHWAVDKRVLDALEPLAPHTPVNARGAEKRASPGIGGGYLGR